MTTPPFGPSAPARVPAPRARRFVGAAACSVALFILAAELVAAPNALVPTGDARRSKIRGGVPVAFASRPLVGKPGLRSGASAEVPVVIELSAPVTSERLTELDAAGARIDGRAAHLVDGSNRFVPARVGRNATAAVAALPTVRRIELDGTPFGAPRPLDGTAAEVEATDLWRASAEPGVPLSGAGLLVCDVDSGIDVFHPMFFRADGGYRAWIDVNVDGKLTPGIDGVDLDGSGNVTVLRVLEGLITNYWDDTPLFGSGVPGYAVGLDWLYADLDGDGQRSFGREGGFDDSSPSFGEPLFVADDVDRDGELDPDEKIVGLGSSKIRAVRYDEEQYWRGESLVDAPREQTIDHGTGAAGVIVGGQRGLTTEVGLAPEAEIIMASQGEAQTDQSYALTRFCVQQGARVVLHEYAPWTGYFLDGSSQLERYIDTSTTGSGVAHINPAGNLSGSQKLYKRAHPAGAETHVAIEVPADNPYGQFEFFALTLLWRDPSRALAVVLQDPTGFERALPTADGQYLYEEWHDGLSIYAERGDSSRGTSKLDVYLFAESAGADPIPAGRWLARVTDPAASGEPDLDLVGYVMDELSGWGFGIHFPEHSSEEHLIGHPGTADHGIAIAAYTGHGTNGGVPGERASYSGRGRRIDGVEILDVAAPDDPVTAGYREGEEGRYFVYGGTSGASPHVAAVAALLLQANPDWTGLEVTDAIHQGALADDATGEVPNDDFGYGKLRGYRSLFGEPPPGGTAPTISVAERQIVRGETTTVTAVVDDADEPSANLRVEIDRDYDGTYEEELPDASFEVRFDALGNVVHKLRVTDSTGHEAATLARLEVVEPPVPPLDPEPAALGPNLVPTGGCLCTAAGRRAPPCRGDAGVLLALATGSLAMARASARRRR